MTTTKRNNIKTLFAAAAVIACAAGGVAMAIRDFPLDTLETFLAYGCMAGMAGGAMNSLLSGDLSFGKKALIGGLVGATGVVALSGIAAAAGGTTNILDWFGSATALVGFSGGAVGEAIVDYPVRAIADWRNNNRARSELKS